MTTTDENNKVKDCRKTVIYVDPEGYIQNAEITKKTVKELEHGEMDKINAIILHRTKSSSEPFDSFKTKKEGTHFVVAKNGTLYQSASLFEWTPHIGKIRSRCQEEKTWSNEEKKYRVLAGILNDCTSMNWRKNTPAGTLIIKIALALKL
ncbi:hypothetical protein [Citrobacter sp. MNAZ 1397]|uniref:hypothetical protein n=1 Tax=Citrobacter sp. MNAZ 1397 TaxID=2911205 RepID=UPI002026DB7F|nr:hypothetical protein [Citrobacter sp. MNAZ 1397]MCL9670321.1 hypothetical protein [Citrobacter sp. MNAZ 1397]